MSDSVSKILVSALSTFKLPVADTLYEGADDEYFVFNFADDNAEDFGDNDVQGYVAYLQIHYICPFNVSYSDMKRKIRNRLIKAGFTPPEVIDVSDPTDRIRHLVFECNIENAYDLEVSDDDEQENTTTETNQNANDQTSDNNDDDQNAGDNNQNDHEDDQNSESEDINNG